MLKRRAKSAKRASMTRETKSFLGRGRDVRINYASVQRGEDLQVKMGDHVHAHRRRCDGCDVMFEWIMLLCDKQAKNNPPPPPQKKRKKKKGNNTHENFLANPNYKQCFTNRSNNVMKDKFLEHSVLLLLLIVSLLVQPLNWRNKQPWYNP